MPFLRAIVRRLQHVLPGSHVPPGGPVSETRSTEGAVIFDLNRLRSSPRDLNEALIRSLCATVRLDDAILCRVLGRYKVYVDSSDVGLAPHLMLDGYWEMHVTEAILGFVRSGMTVVDVGANQGYFTMLLADLVGPTGHVFAAEPNPRMMDMLQKSVLLNGFRTRVVSIAQALSRNSGDTVTLHIPKDLPQNGSIMWNGNETSKPVVIDTLSLDDLIGDGPVDFIKIDVEGAEEAVWDGMARIIARNRPLSIILEFTPNRYADPEGFLNRIRAGGFSVAQIDPRHGVRAVSFDEVLEAPGHIDRMLVLAR